MQYAVVGITRNARPIMRMACAIATHTTETDESNTTNMPEPNASKLNPTDMQGTIPNLS